MEKLIYTFIVLYCIWFLDQSSCVIDPADEDAARDLMKSAQDIMRETNLRIKGIQLTRLLAMDHFAWQIGYIIFELQEKYRKLIDKFNSSVFMDKRYFLMEHVLFLVEIEYHYWEIDHYTLLLHEVELKYKQNLTYPTKSTEPTTTMTTDTIYDDEATPDIWNILTKDMTKQTTSRTRISNEYSDLFERWTSTKRRPTRWWWIGEYGWDPDKPFRRKK